MEGESFAAKIFGLLLLACIIGASIFAYVVITADDEQEGESPSGAIETPIDILVDPDLDDDTWINERDNCPEVFNPANEDTDEDGIGDECDDTEGPSSFDLRGLFLFQITQKLAL